MYQLNSSLQALEGKREQLAEILLEAAEIVSSLSGSKLYIVSKDNCDSLSIWITEVWDSKEDHDNSLKSDSVKALIGEALPLLNGMPSKGQELEILGGHGIIK
jgi:quinol monooxygenase YgiN